MTDIVEKLRNLADVEDWDIGEEAALEIERLRSTVNRVQNAAKTIMIGEADELMRLREKNKNEWVASKSLDSEREANAILTEEIERLREALEWALNHIGGHCRYDSAQQVANALEKAHKVLKNSP